MSNHASPLQRKDASRTLQQKAPSNSDNSKSPPAFDLQAGAPLQMAVENEVQNLDNLRGEGVDPDMSMGRELSGVDRNSPTPSDPLPWREDGSWDAEEILTHLGQLDTIGIPQSELDAANAANASGDVENMRFDNSTTTDSDSVRCVQAVSLAARVLQGPGMVRAYFASAIITAMLSGHHDARAITAAEVLNNVSAKIEAGTATYGDLSWAQEALHDMFYDDASGTPMDEVIDQMNPVLDFTGSTTTTNDWYETPADALAAANALQPGQQMVATIFTVSVNVHLDETDPGDQRIIRGRNLPPNNGKPAAGDLNDAYDTFQGHQIMIMKMPDGGVRIYDPEQNSGGTHFGDANSGDVGLAHQFQDQPDFQMYRYLNVMGVRSPMDTSSGFSAP